MMSVTDALTSAPRSLTSKLVAQHMLDVQVLKFSTKYCTDTEMRYFQIVKMMDFTQNLSNFSAQVDWLLIEGES